MHKSCGLCFGLKQVEAISCQWIWSPQLCADGQAAQVVRLTRCFQLLVIGVADGGTIIERLARSGKTLLSAAATNSLPSFSGRCKCHTCDDLKKLQGPLTALSSLNIHYRQRYPEPRYWWCRISRRDLHFPD